MATHVITTSTQDDERQPGGITSRRSLLGAAAPAALMLSGAGIGTAVAAHAPQLDAELIALCAQLDALERAYLATDFATDFDTPADDAAEAERERIAGAQKPIVDAICGIPPRTLAGAVAVAGSLALWDAGLLTKGGEGHCTDNRLMAALVCGLVGHTSAVPPASNPDAGLLVLCAEHQRLHALAYLEGNDDWEAAHHESWQVADKINDLVPVTQAGHRAKAAVAVAQMDDNWSNGDWMGDRDALFALNVLKDWLGLS